MSERSDGLVDIVLGPENSGSKIGAIYHRLSGIPYLPVHKTPENGAIPEGNYIGVYVPSYTRFGEYDLLWLDVNEFREAISGRRIRVGLVEDIIDTFHVADKMRLVVKELHKHGIDATIVRVMALFDKYYMQTPDRQKAEREKVSIDAALQFTDMGINPAFVRLRQEPELAFQSRQ